MAKLIKKMLEIRKGLYSFSRDTKGFNFSYVSGDQVLSKFRELADSQGVMLTTSVLEHTLKEDEYTVQVKGEVKRKVNYLVDGVIEFTFWDVDSDEKLVTRLPLLGLQTDPSQALGSALTYCERYNLMKQFSVPTDIDDPDAKQGKVEDKGKKKPDTTENDSDHDFHRDDFIPLPKPKEKGWTWKTADADYLQYIADKFDPGYLVDFANKELHIRNIENVRKETEKTIKGLVTKHGDTMRDYLKEIGVSSPAKLKELDTKGINDVLIKVTKKAQEIEGV